MQKNNYVLISGATSGIGLELARLYAKDGYNLILISRSQNDLEKTKSELIKNNNIEIEIFAYDLSKIENVYDLYEKIEEKNFIVQTLVNNAGFGDSCEFVYADINRLNQMVDLNIKSLMNMCHLFAKDMMERRNGDILNVASVAAYLGGPYMATYYATKAFVLNFSIGLYHELKKFGVRMHILCPGPTKTKFIDVAESQNKKAFNNISMKADKVAKICYKKVKRNKLIINTGFISKFTSFGTRFMSRKFAAKMTQKINGKI